MDTQSTLSFQELFNQVVGDMAKAVSERNGETKSGQFIRFQAAAQMIMGFLPRDAIEAMLAGHCVMFHEMMTDSIRDTLRGEADTTRRGTRAGIIAMDKAFGANLTRLERYKLRISQGQRDAPEARPADAEAGPGPGQPAEARTRPAQPREIPVVSQPEPTLAATDPIDGTTIIFHPSAAVVAECRANPEAMAALDAGDPERFASAMGIDMPAGTDPVADRQAPDPGSVFRPAGSPSGGSNPPGRLRVSNAAAPVPA